ncbi:acyl-CoA dehydrogenase [Streptomyces triticagri]|uniref:Acyl-CoA dehydrogenase n=1 Tax=Streptomyces triticagri TaxID=2293568 RepID=A0A372LXX6_9ACTN|nr:acyl-CoA dehydrogenase family protein [Streptomyces triticagri]RFU82897.1 acyl-CoA dehydrogenase [Streptomyces triticagri]
MDFTPTEEQAAARDLAAGIFRDLSTPERLAKAGRSTDRELWSALCAAGLPGAVEEIGLLGLVLLLEEQGRGTAQVPFAVTCLYGVHTVSEHGTAEQRERLLPLLASGAEVMTGAFPLRSVVAEADGAGWRLTGVLTAVPWLRDATRVLVPARVTLPDGTVSVGCFLVGTGRTDGDGPPEADDVEAPAVEAVELTAPWSAGRLTLDRTPGELLGAPGRFERPADLPPGHDGRDGHDGRSGADTRDVAGYRDMAVYRDVLASARVAFAGLQAGVCAGSLARAVEYTSVREQFGRPLAAKQAVLLRAADAHMDTEAIRVTAYEGSWRRDQHLPHQRAALTAAWWASEAGKRVVHTGQHLHGGTGADVEHPVHRHFLWGRQLDAYLGPGAEILAELGDTIATEETV